MFGDEVRTKAKDKVLTDRVLENPVDRYQLRFRCRLVIILVIILLLLWAARFGRRFLVDRPVDYSRIEEHFKYGSIGSEPGGSLFYAVGGLLPPYWIFRALPKICPDKLPGGYASLGFIFESGRDLPIGVSKRQRLGFEQVGLNCAGCHTGTYRDEPNGEPHIVLGMPAHSLDLQKFFSFVIDCSLDERFNADNVIEKVREAGGRVGVLDRFLYRSQLIPRIRETTRQLNERIQILLSGQVPAWGVGRVDTFNPYKAIQFNWDLKALPKEQLTGAADFPSLWNQRPRDGMQLHWDGNNNSVDERNLSAALGAGVTPVTVDHPRLERVRNWIWTLPPPKYPYKIDPVLAAKGRDLYADHCGSCHDFDGSEVGRVEPIGEINTDPRRLNSYTYIFAANQYTLYPDSKYRFVHFRKTNGYANQPLDGVWARAPYLHNGSVPTLRDLLEPPDKRPAEFFRGYDLYDRKNVGFVSNVAGVSGRRFFKYDTKIAGNENRGHLYGTKLTPEQKDALVEYMKTL
jgi:RoxA-like, cytochrome c-like